MDNVLNELNELKRLILDQNLLKKEVLNFREACHYLDISESHMYKLTSRRLIPHFCPQGKKLYFNRHDLDNWLQKNQKVSIEEIEKEAVDFVTKNRRR